MKDEIELIIDGKSYMNWKEISTSRSMTAISGDFNFVSSTKWDDRQKASGFGIYLDAKCLVKLNGRVIHDGYIDEAPISYSKDNYQISFAGRDKTSDLVDCPYDVSIAKNELKGQTAESIISKLCSQFDISVDFDDAGALESMTSNSYQEYAISPTTPVYEQIAALCRAHGVLAFSYGNGFLTIGRAGVKKSKDSLEGGVNVLSAELDQSNTERYHKYLVKGMIDKGTITVPASQLKGEAYDFHIRDTRSLTIVDTKLNSLKACQDRAWWELRMRAGKSRSVRATVQGWSQSDGSPWMINRLIDYKDDRLGIDTTLLIASVDSFLSPTQGSTTTMSLVYPETFKFMEKDIKKKSKEFKTFTQEAAEAKESAKAKIPETFKFR